MTAFETFFLQTTDYLDKLGVPYFLHGSTLLQIIRSQQVEPRQGDHDVALHDSEINIGVLAEDFTEQHYMKLRRDHPFYFEPINGVFPNALIYYAQAMIPEGRSKWDIKPGFTLLARFFKGTNSRIEYMGDTHCLVFPKDMFNKRRWDKVEVLGKTFNIPGDHEEYLSYYFGGDWKIENQGWHWSQAKCYQTVEQLGGGEIYG